METIICVSAFPVAADGKFLLSPGREKLSCTRIWRKILSWQRLISWRGITHTAALLPTAGPFKKAISKGQSHKKIHLPTHNGVSAICSFWEENKISEKTDCSNEGRKCSELLHDFLLEGGIHSHKKLPPDSLSQKFPNFPWAKAEEAITSNESRTIDAEIMHTWNSHTGLSLLIPMDSSCFELLKMGLFTVL